MVSHYAMKTHAAVDIYRSTFSWSWLYLEVSNQLHARPFYIRGKSHRYSLDRSLGSPRAGLDDLEKTKFFTLPELELRPLGRAVCSQSPHLLLYRGSPVIILLFKLFHILPYVEYYYLPLNYSGFLSVLQVIPASVNDKKLLIGNIMDVILS
jgi:hypothetical protein